MSHTIPNFEFSDYGVCEYDPQVDFTQVLEEARLAQRAGSLRIPASEKRGMGHVEKVKKSWKNSLLNWWKSERKSRASTEAARNSCPANQHEGHVSGPINGHRRSDASMRRTGRTSGQLGSLFNSAKNMENETPYMCLNRVNSCPVRAYGPVYLVT